MTLAGLNLLAADKLPAEQENCSNIGVCSASIRRNRLEHGYSGIRPGSGIEAGAREAWQEIDMEPD